jgi:hypothetical protein
VAPGKFFQRTQVLPALPNLPSLRCDAPKGHPIWPSSVHSSNQSPAPHMQLTAGF